MKRFVLLPCIVVLLFLWSTVGAVKLASTGPIPARIPVLESRYLPGEQRPSEARCEMHEYEFKSHYCQVNDGLSLILKDNTIIQADSFVYGSNQTVSQVVLEWGQPIGADYGISGAVSLYWKDRSIYAVSRHDFGPDSTVEFIAYRGIYSQITRYNPWRGFATNNR